jgi:hypothetical protein
MKNLTSFFSLFGSIATLLCCALPVTLVALGMGATFASLTSTFPQIIWITQYKNTLFITTGLILIASYLLMKNAEKLACPVDQDKRKVCSSSRNFTKYTLYVSLILYCIGLLFSFVIPRILYGL